MKLFRCLIILSWSLASTADAFSLHRQCHTFVGPRHSYHLWQPNRYNVDGPAISERYMLPVDSLSSLDAPSSADPILSFWVLAFASSHIGMSAIRSKIIQSLGEAAKSLNLVGNEDWTLPRWWPGDNTGGSRIFPDDLTAGRQVYRVLYTLISFVTLGSALGAYLHSSSITGGMSSSATMQSTNSAVYNLCLFSAALSFGAAIASIFNASPLGLMPSFEDVSSDDNESNSIAGIRRDDTLKFTTSGLTRITRHPLILPVVPWGFATAYLAGGRPCDYILFGGLSIYALVGCFAQDLRVIREEGSVGTVFQTESGQRLEGTDEDERTQLRSFFEDTSFVPFKAVLDGRQDLDDIIREGPWLQFAIGTVFGVFLEDKILQLLEQFSVNAQMMDS